MRRCGTAKHAQVMLTNIYSSIPHLLSHIFFRLSVNIHKYFVVVLIPDTYLSTYIEHSLHFFSFLPIPKASFPLSRSIATDVSNIDVTLWPSKHVSYQSIVKCHNICSIYSSNTIFKCFSSFVIYLY